jgi:HD-GYP domain-containing protein (c-di-GMP phosphodiesterase class II)
MLKKISLAQLKVGMFITSCDESWLKHSLWRTNFVVKDLAVLEKVQQSGVTQLWIDVERGADVTPAPSALQETAAVRRPAVEETPPPARRDDATSLEQELMFAAALRTRSKDAVRTIFAEVRLGHAVDLGACRPLVDDVIASINRNVDALVSLVRLKSTDEYTYMHSLAVCTLMVALGRRLGFDDQQCRDAGLAGMLHDLGKAAIPQEILNKPGKLSVEEMAIVRQHPVLGHAMLLAGGGLSEGVLDVCLHHHERADGKGYPHALPLAQISLLARMGAVCDVYDAITSDRPYKGGWDAAESIAQMASWHGHFDPQVFQAFVKSVGIYPTGSLVRMTSGKLGIVIEQSAARLTAPKVRVFFSTRSSMPLQPVTLDLSDPLCRDQIESRESRTNWKFTGLDELWAGEFALLRMTRH